MRKAIILAIFATQLGSFSLLAQERGERLEQMFSRLDKNADGFLDASEAPSELWAKIGKADKNGDSKIDKAEAREGFKEMAGGQRRPGKSDGNESTAKRDGEVAKRGSDSAKREKSAADTKADQANSPESTPPQADRVKQLFERYSKNGDGKVPLADLPAPLRERFAKFDKNDDKLLEPSELKDAPMSEAGGEAAKLLDRVRQMMQSLDKDGDGKVALADMPEQFRERLSKFDKNQDGSIERGELAELRRMVGDGGRPMPEMMERAQQLFAQYDKDGDGKIALDDLPAPIQDRLTQLDKNNDGFIEKSEIKDGASEMKNRTEGRGERGEDLAPQQPKRPDPGN